MRTPMVDIARTVGIVLSTALTWSASIPTPVRALDSVLTWKARHASFRGNTSCSYGDPGCNRCVNDVRKQFDAMTRDGQMVEMINGWTWEDRDYKPSSFKPTEVLTMLPGSFNIPLPGQDLSIGPGSGSHFQSIVRSQSSSPALFASYGGDKAAIFMVDTPERTSGEIGAGALQWLYPGETTHPGGMAAIGEYLVVASDDDDRPLLHFLNVSDAPRAGVTRDISTAVANVSAVQLDSEGYLLLTTTTSKRNEYRVWFTTSLDSPRIEEVAHDFIEASGPEVDVDGSHGFENTTLITECGTGDIYMLGVNGKPDISADNKGLWYLYKLTADGRLQYVSRNTRNMHGAACNTRASGSAFAGPEGELVFYCHQKGQRATQRADGISCAVNSAIPLAATVVPLYRDDANEDGSIDKGAWSSFKSAVAKHYKKAVLITAAATVPGAAETVAAVAGSAAATATAAAGTAAATGAAVAGSAAATGAALGGSAIATATATAVSAVATGTAVAGTAVATASAVAGTLVNNFAVNTLVIPNGACMRAISADTRIFYTEFWPTGD